jgi:iron complex transport system substrate-binding protein
MTFNHYPHRIVCLAAEAPEILDRLGAFDRVVAVSGFARQPSAVRQLPKVGGFSDPDIEKILTLQPDLVVTTSDIQAEAAAACIRQGIPVLALNPHRLADVWQSILLLGGILGLQAEAKQLVTTLQEELEGLRLPMGAQTRPRVYFEEWPDPLISGIGWVSDLIEVIGGVDIFCDRGAGIRAVERVVSAEEVIARQPDLIIASWCGKKADLASIRQRPGWQDLPAVRQGQVHEIASQYILQTGPSLLAGARRLQQLLVQMRPQP